MTTRTELKQQYKDNPPAMGVFAIRNMVSGKVLIGVSLNVPGSLNRARFELTRGTHRNQELQSDWNTLGADQFRFEVLDELKPLAERASRRADDLRELEALWLDKLQPFGANGYNELPKPQP